MVSAKYESPMPFFPLQVSILKSSLSYDEVIARLDAITHHKAWLAGDYNCQFIEDCYHFKRDRDWFSDRTFETLVKLWIIQKDSNECDFLVKVYPGILGIIRFGFNFLIILDYLIFIFLFYNVSRNDFFIFKVIPVFLIMYSLLDFCAVVYAIQKDKEFLRKLLE